MDFQPLVQAATETAMITSFDQPLRSMGLIQG